MLHQTNLYSTARQAWPPSAAPPPPNRDGRLMIGPLVQLLQPRDILLTLHLDDRNAPIVIDQFGEDTGALLLAEMLESAEAFHRDGPPSAVDLDGCRLARLRSRETILHMPVKSRRGRSSVILSIVFAAEARIDPAALSSTLRLMLPQIVAYFRLWQQNRAQERTNSALGAVLNLLDLGILLLDQHGQIRFSNNVADGLLADGRFMRRVGQSFSAIELSAAMKLQGAIIHAIASNAARAMKAAPTPHATMLKLMAGDQKLIVAVAAADDPAMETHDVAAMVLILSPTGDPARMLLPVCQLYGLSPVESRLACRIVAGDSLQDAASALRIKEQTARSYLKQIFLKTETRRQADLVRIMLSSIVRMRSVPLLQSV